MSKRVFVAISGGVDSAVAAALLQKQDYDVKGIHMKLWQPPFQTSKCSWEDDLSSAQAVAKYLNIDFDVWDFSKEYEQRVVEYLFKEYESGRTPNPDVMCNRQIKFGLFYERAISLGAQFVATGHYSRISNGKLYRGVDPNKDQSYFLWAIPKEKLSRIIFPLGSMTKPEVRLLAKEIGLPNADRKDSQGICFIGKIDLVEFLKLRLPSREGKIVATNGRVLGKHHGAWFYTIGQRHGFGLAVGEPRYVAQKDVNTNELVVVQKNDKALSSSGLYAGAVNWFDDVSLNSKIKAQVRYQQSPVAARFVELTNDGFTLELDPPVQAVAPGQSVVLYQNNALIGGGIIESNK